MFEMLGLYEEALIQYDEIDALLTQLVINSKYKGIGREQLYVFYFSPSSLLLKDQLDQRFSQVHMVDFHIDNHLMAGGFLVRTAIFFLQVFK